MRYILLALLISCSACASKVQWATVEPTATLAVAHFIHPKNDWELMAGVLPDEASVIPPQTLTALDEQLSATVEKMGTRPVMRAAMVHQCEEIVLASKERQHFETVEYWKAVGQCMNADFLLVPFVTRWQKRDGDE